MFTNKLQANEFFCLPALKNRKKKLCYDFCTSSVGEVLKNHDLRVKRFREKIKTCDFEEKNLCAIIHNFE